MTLESTSPRNLTTHGWINAWRPIVGDCCETAPAAPATAPAACPTCRTRGKPVDPLTVKALLTEQALTRLRPGGHRFCAAPGCEVVYFDDAGQTFSTDDVHVVVWQKCRAGRRTICYCFGENEDAIQEEVKRTGGSEATARVRAHIAANRCACEMRNPAGVCCLGDLAQTVRRAVESAQAVSASRHP